LALCDEATVAQFHEFMLDRPRVWKDQTGLNHWSRFFQLVRNRRGIEAARILVHRQDLTEGFLRLKATGRLDLTVEWAIAGAVRDEDVGVEDPGPLQDLDRRDAVAGEARLRLVAVLRGVDDAPDLT
jgi:hypothetical protein